MLRYILLFLEDVKVYPIGSFFRDKFNIKGHLFFWDGGGEVPGSYFIF